MTNHRNAVGDLIHTPYRQVFADDAARAADNTVYNVGDLHKKAYQVDTNTEFVLTAIGPTTWTALGGGVQGGAFPSANKRVTQSLATIAQGGDITVQLAGLTAGDILTASAGMLALSIWIMSRYSGGNARQEQYTALLDFSAGAGDPNTRIAANTEQNLLSDTGLSSGVIAALADLVGPTGVVEIQFTDDDGTAGTADAVVVGTLSDYYEL